MVPSVLANQIWKQQSDRKLAGEAKFTLTQCFFAGGSWENMLPASISSCQVELHTFQALGGVCGPLAGCFPGTQTGSGRPRSTAEPPAWPKPFQKRKIPELRASRQRLVAAHQNRI